MKNARFILLIMAGVFFTVTSFASTPWVDGVHFSWEIVKGKELLLLRYGLYENGKEANSFVPTTNETFTYGSFNDIDVLLHGNGLEGNELYTAHLADEKKHILLINDVKNENNRRVWLEAIMFRRGDDLKLEVYTVDNLNTYRVLKVK